MTKRYILILAFLFSLLSGVARAQTSVLTVTEVDGVPTKTSIQKLVFPNGSVTITGSSARINITGGGGGGGAPVDATYIVKTANPDLTAEQALSSLSSGILRVATSTGTLTSLTTSSGISANISDETGSGVLVFATSPTLVTPILGVATATSVNILNSTAATVLVQSQTPGVLAMEGQKWNVGNSASHRRQLQALWDLSGTIPTLKLQTALDGGSWTNRLTLTDTGLLTVPGDITAASFQVASGAISIDGGSITTVGGYSISSDVSLTISAPVIDLSQPLTVANGGTGLGALGTALQVLRVNAGATALEFATASGGGTLTGTGTTNALPKYTAGTVLGDSLLSEASGDITQATGKFYLGTGGTRIGLRNNGGIMEAVDGTPALAEFAAQGLTANTVYAAGNLYMNQRIASYATGSQIKSPTDGVWQFLNNAGTGFSRLALGPADASNPALKASGTGLQARLGDDSAFGAISASNLISGVAGSGLQLQSGTGQRAGNATLVGGTVTVTNSTVGAASHILITRKTAGGTIGAALTYTISNGTSFTVTSDNALDTSVIEYFIFEIN